MATSAVTAGVAPAVPEELAREVVRAQLAFDPLVPWLLALLLVLMGAVFWRWGAARPWPPATQARVRAAVALGLLWAALAWGLFGAPAAPLPVLQTLDAAAAAWARDVQALPALPWLAVRLSDLGELLVLAGVTGVVTAGLLLARRPALALGWVLAIGINSLAVRVLKNLFARARPLAGEPSRMDGAGDWITSGFSFPSGHAAGSAMVYGVLAWLLCQRVPPAWRWQVGLACALLVGGVAISRVLLGVHFLSDVVGGLLWAGALGLLAVTVLDRLGATAVNSIPDRPLSLR